MQTNAEHARHNWSWWTDGDLPVRTDSHVTALVDGRHALWTMCLHFLTARHAIYLANWGIAADMQLVRGSDHRAGPDGSPQQNDLVEELRAFGLSPEDITFWTTQDLTVKNVLAYGVSKGVVVKVLLWACPEIFSHYSPKTAHEELTGVGVHCLLDDSASRLPHPSESLHQKITIIDSAYAFVGGIDPLIELSGDFDRWDTPWHAFASALRSNPKDADPHTWHDAHALIVGSAARDVEFNFYQRWNETVTRQKLNVSLLVPEPVRAELDPSTQSLVQIARTIPVETYHFAPKEGIRGIAQMYANVLSSVQGFVYLENQYFWLHAFMGIDIGDFGPANPEMEHNLRVLAESLERGASVALVLPDHPNVGRAFTDIGLNHLRVQAPNANAAGRIQAFCLANSMQKDGEVHYRPVYVHAKVAIIDDAWTTIGSANLNNRGMRDDAEINVAVLDGNFARNLRILLWAEHLGLLNEDEQFIVSRYVSRWPQHPSANQRAQVLWEDLTHRLGEPAAGMRAFIECAQANLQHFRNGEPLVGHLFPYLTVPEAHQLGIPLHESHGVFETPQ